MDSIFAKLDGFEYVLIYGAGGIAEDFLILLEPYFDSINIGVAVTKTEGDKTLREIPVKELSDYYSTASSSFVIIAAMPRYVEEMRSLLIENGFVNNTDVYELCGDIYKELWKEKIVNNKILFSNYKGLGFGDNGKYIAKKILESSEEYDIVWAVSEDNYQFPTGIRTVVYGTYEYYRELATAHVWIDNRHKSRLSYKREGQYYIQTWHGGGPLKKIEHDGNGISQSYLDLCDYDSGIIDLMISPTKFNSGLYRTAFNYHGEIFECGYPRNDLFFHDNGSRKAVEERFGISKENMIILYAPTFRSEGTETSETLDLHRVRSVVEKRYDRNVSIMVRSHPDVRCSNVSDGFIDATSYDDAQELLAAADILITDYSSIMWDFSLQKKPVFLFQPDRSDYEKERGYYLSFEKMPYLLAGSTDELCSIIRTFDEEKYVNELEHFLSDYGSFDSGKAADSILERIELICGEGKGET